MYCMCPNEQSGGIREAICKENKQELFVNAFPGHYLSIVAKPWINPFDVQGLKDDRKVKYSTEHK